MKNNKVIVLVVVLLLIGGFLLFGPLDVFRLEYLQSRLGSIQQYRADNPLISILIYCIIYITATAASIPGAAMLSLLGGAVFGFFLGTVLALISATIGATIAFLLARYLFDDMVKARMGERLERIRQRFREEGALYLFSMRLVPVIPFFVINLLMGLTSIRTTTFAMASLIGMAPGAMIYVNAGTQLARLESISGLLSPAIMVSLVLLATFPYLAKYGVRFIRARANRRTNINPGDPRP